MQEKSSILLKTKPNPEKSFAMTAKTETQTQTLADILANVSPDELAAFVAKYNAETASTAEANAILAGDADHTGKMYPEDSRDTEKFPTVDEVRDAFFAFAATVAETIVITPGDPNGSQARTRADKRTVELPTPSGTLKVSLS